MKLFAILMTVFTVSSAFAGYTVPVGERTELAPFARFELPDYKLEINNGRATIQYTLPLALTGTPVHIQASGSARSTDALVMTGPFADITCNATQCRVGYQAVNIDRDARENFLREISKTETEFQMRLKVARIFDADPIGTIDRLDVLY